MVFHCALDVWYLTSSFSFGIIFSLRSSSLPICSVSALCSISLFPSPYPPHTYLRIGLPFTGRTQGHADLTLSLHLPPFPSTLCRLSLLSSFPFASYIFLPLFLLLSSTSCPIPLPLNSHPPRNLSAFKDLILASHL